MISKELAQKVANQVMKDIEYNINVMDAQGIIIASGDRSRIGDSHQGAKKVMASKKRNIIYEETLTEKQGINDPIFIENECVGVVGISGDPADVLKIKNVVNSLFYFLISREIEMSQQFSEKEARQKVIRKMIYQEEPLTSEEMTYLTNYQVTYQEEKYVVVTNSPLKSLNNHLLYHEKSDGLTVLLLSVKQVGLEGGLEKVLKRLFKEFGYFGVTRVHQQTHHGYQQALGTLNFIRLVEQPRGIYDYRDYRVFVNILEGLTGEQDELNQGILLIKQDPMLYETLLSYFEHNGHMKETAEDLIIHRNTLLYRLNKMKELTGIDPTTFKGLTNLIYMLLMIEREVR